MVITMKYSRQFGSRFPEKSISVGVKRDVDDSVKDLISQYYSYIDAGNLDAAYLLYQENKTALEPYMIDMSYINRLEEEIYNAHIATLNKITTIVSDAMPLSQSDNSFWLQKY